MSERRCWNCGTKLLITDEFCPNCGVDFNVHGAETAPAHKLCTVCGTSFEIDPYTDPNESRCYACRHLSVDDIMTDKERREVDAERMRTTKGIDYRNMRNAQRFEVAKCFVRVHARGLTARLVGKHKVQMGPLIDLSTTGMQCRSEGVFGKGDAVEVELLVPAFNQPLLLRGTVRWAQPDKGGTRMGVQFDPADEKTHTHLRALESHPDLRDAAKLREKNATSGEHKAVTQPKQSKNRPADF